MLNIKKWLIEGPAAKRDTAVVSLFLLAYLLFLLFHDLSLSLGVPHEIYFSEAVFEGINVGKRANILYGVVLVAVVLYLIIYTLLYFQFRWARLNNKQSQSLMILSISGFFSVFSTVIGWNATLLSDALMLVVFLKISVYSLANLKQGFFRIIGSDTLSNIGLSLAFIFYFTFIFLFNNHPVAQSNFALIYPVIFFGIILIFTTINQHTGISNRRAFFLLASLGLIPIYAFIAGESTVFFKLKYDLLIRFKYLFIGFVILGVSVSGIFLLINKSKSRLSGKKLLEWFLLPSVLLCLLILAYYTPFPRQSTEIFELANPANSMLRFFAHRQIPFIDYMSSHMLSEQWYGMIYHSIFGFDNSLDFSIYEFFNRIVIAFVIYFFLNRLFGSKELTLLFMVSFPFVFTIFFIHIIMAVVLYHISIRATAKQTTGNYILLFLTTILLFIWRLDTGTAGLFTIIFFTPLLFIIHRKNPRWMALLKAGVITALIIASSIIVSLILRSPDYITENFLAALNYAKSTLAHGYYRLGWSHPHQFFIYHYFLPLLSLISIVVTVTLLRRDKISISSTKCTPALASIFFLLLYLANGQRGLVRHSFLSGTEMFLASTFFVGLALFITFLFERHQKNTNRYFVFFSSAFLVFVLLKFFPLGKNEAFFQTALKSPSFAQFDLNFGEERLTQRTFPDYAFQEVMYTDLKLFLDNNLTADQTFLDFSNTPMLYYYCERRIPGYFNQNLQNTVNDYLQLHLLKQVDPDNTPVVVFSNIPHNWFDATDGVPNVMRYYLIAEYIFEHYEPFGIISNKSIWVAKGLEYVFEPMSEDQYTLQTHQFDYKKSAHFAGQYYHHYQPATYEKVWHWEVPDEYLTGKVSVDLPGQAGCVKNAWLQVMIDSDHNQDDVWLHLIKDDQVIGKFTFHVIRGRRFYLLRPGNHYYWSGFGADKLELEIRDRMYLKGINILKDNRIENRNTDIY